MLNGEALAARGVLLAVVVRGTTDEHNVSVSVTQTQPQRKRWEIAGRLVSAYQRKGSWLCYWL